MIERKKISTSLIVALVIVFLYNFVNLNSSSGVYLSPGESVGINWVFSFFSFILVFLFVLAGLVFLGKKEKQNEIQEKAVEVKQLKKVKIEKVK